MLRPAIALIAFAAVQPVLAADPDPKAAEFFESKIRPVLVKHCYSCHSVEAKTQKKLKAGLRLDRKEHLLAGGESGPALVPGDAKKSLLIQVMKAEGSERMPPDKPLPANVIADFEKWIQDGAFDPRTGADDATTDADAAKNHWAFQPLRVPPVPAGRDAIDHLIQANLKENGLPPAPLADRRTLLRRAVFDLTGLPPTPEEAEAFLKDESPDAYVKLIERLLASRHYGEKWGRHWLDVVRYADTAGETADFPLPEAWRYRNYVIDSFNADKPFDRFITEQLAGDILARTAPANERPALLAATGYLALSRRFGFDVRADHFLTIEDTIDTLGKSFLGLTIGCARCHDHKYDPIPMADYYALYGIFESTKFAMPGCEKDKRQHDLVSLARPADVAVLGGMAARESVYGVVEGSPHDAQLHKRGDPETRGITIPRRWLTVFGGQALPKDSGSGRLKLAEWIADPKNPLTARVMVNRVWQYHFGRGLVSTPNDFGTRGMKPSHPELLDHLTAEFIRSGWSVKQLHRRIMHSEAYRRSSEAASERDAGNTWLGRFNRRRLTAEEIRDTILAVSGDLDPSPGTRHPFPAEGTWNFTQHAPFLAVYEHDKRSVYIMSQRIKRHPFLALFDGADPNRSTDRRDTTTVPTQALYFLNDPFVHAKSQKLAARIVKHSETERLDTLYLRMLNRKPTEDERTLASKFLGDGGEKQWAAWIRVMFAGNEFLYVD
jgi:hypothetical protein